MHEPLFPSADEISRRIEIAKQFRSHYLRRTFRRATHNIIAQTRTTRTVEASAAVVMLIAGVFWLAILSAPKVTEAGEPEISKQQSLILP